MALLEECCGTVDMQTRIKNYREKNVQMLSGKDMSEYLEEFAEFDASHNIHKSL